MYGLFHLKIIRFRVWQDEDDPHLIFHLLKV